jgi:hypothetical protein
MSQTDRRLGIRHATVWLACAALLAGASTSSAGNIVDVRVGTHPDHTRIVIELDAPSAHRVTRRANAEGDLAIRVEAVGAPRRVDSRSPLVEAVTLMPEDGGAVAQVALREAGLEYSELLLESPPRIVIDVRRSGLAATSPPADAAEPARDWRRDPFAPPASYAELVAAQQAEAAKERGSQKEVPAPAAKAPEAARAEAQSSKPTDEAPAAAVEGVGTPVAATTPPPVTAAAPSPTAAPPHSPAAPNPRVLSAPPAPAGLPTDVESTLGKLRNRVVGLGTVLPILALAALVLVWIVYRRLVTRQTRARALGAQEEEVPIFKDAFEGFREPVELRDEPAIAPLVEVQAAPEVEVHQAAEVEAGEPESVVAAQEIDAAHAALADPAESVVATPAPEPVIVPHEEAQSGWEALPIPPAASASPEPVAELPPIVTELERRIALLEGRIEELVESRLRLERFAAAQSEELRVQRAAIARTQRVLRGLVKPEDPASESSPSRTVPAPPRSV